jgi:hypothetical protein
MITKTVWIEPQPIEVFQEPIFLTDFSDEMIIPETITTIEQPEKTQINWSHLVAGFYLIGVLFFLVKFVLSSLSLYKILHKAPSQKQNGFRFIDSKSAKTPFSFFNYIVFDSSKFSEEELQNIIAHEKVHCKQKHSIDVLFSELFTIVFWFNPFMWFYKKAIQQNLEFIADNKAIKTTENKVNYQKTLLKITLNPRDLALANPFFQPLIKKRIMMLNKNQSKQRNVWKYTVVLPLLVLFMIQFQTKVVAQEKESKPQENQTSVILEMTTVKDSTGAEATVIRHVDEESTYNPENDKKVIGGKIYIAGATEESAPLIIINGKEQENVFYPKDLRIQVQGKGSYTKYDPKQAVEKFGEKGRNGAYVIEAEKFTIVPVYSEKTSEKISIQEKKPLIIVNGKEIDNKDISLVETKGLVTHYDTETAVKKFGEKAKDGAIVIEGEVILTSKRSQTYTTYDYPKPNHYQNIDAIVKDLDIYGKEQTPIYIVNGKEISEEEFKKLHPNYIHKLQLLDDKEAYEKYRKGRFGAFEIQYDSLKTRKEALVLQRQSLEEKERLRAIKEQIKEEQKKVLEEKRKIREELDQEIKSGGFKVYRSKDLFEDLANSQIDYKKAHIIINDKEATYKDLENLNQNMITLRSTINGAEYLVRDYGEKAKYGVIQIETKDFKGSMSEELENVRALRKDKNYKLLDEYHDGFIIHKLSQYDELEYYKAQLNKVGITMKVSNLRRNKKGEISKIKISLVEDSENGNNKRKAKSEAVFEAEPIPDIFVGRKNGSLVVSSDKAFR